MDPNENLKEQLELAKRLQDGGDDLEDADRLAVLVLSLNEWISNGGFLPSAWEK